MCYGALLSVGAVDRNQAPTGLSRSHLLYSCFQRILNILFQHRLEYRL